MSRIGIVLLAMLLSTAAQAAEYMEKTPFQLSRAFSPGVITSGGITVWVAGQTATQDSQGNNIAICPGRSLSSVVARPAMPLRKRFVTRATLAVS